MKIYTSYFYQIRFMDKSIVPVSTAIWDPKWFHQFKGQDYIFKDKNGVYNGIRAEMFAPGPVCADQCRGRDCCNTGDPAQCKFLQNYRLQLNQLDINEILSRCNSICERVRALEGVQGEMSICFIVHEAPSNPCSERRVIQEWFKFNGIEVKEWTKI